MQLLLMLLWTIPALLRTWRLAKFYQIEEYMPRRFLRWIIIKRDRRVPQRPALVMLMGILLAVAMQIATIDTPLLHFGLWLIIGGIVALPEPIKETKKTFNRTPRAVRIVGAAFAVMFVGIVLVAAFTTRNMDTDTPQEISTIAIVGFLGFMLAPIALPTGFLLMYPVDAAQREGYRRQARARLAQANPLVIGVTGSYGKTSTKQFLAHILGGKHKVYATPKSYNTEMGVCLAINTDLDPNYGFEYFITEMGAYIPGEIKRIAQLTKPKMSIVTAVGPMHLERFKTIDNIIKAKYEIVEGVPQDGATFFNGDNEYVLGMAQRGYPDKRIIVSQDGLAEARFVAENVQQTLAGLSFEVVDTETDTRQPFKTKLVGLHNVTNILLATAVAHFLGMTLPEIGMRVATLETSEHRLNINRLPNGMTIIDDAYSANPTGARSALDVLKLHEAGRRIVITPGMVELGAVEAEENFKLGQYLTETATDIVLVGIEQTQPLYDGIQQTDFDQAHVLVFDTFQAAQTWFQTQVRAGDAVLFLNDLPDTYL